MRMRGVGTFDEITHKWNAVHGTINSCSAYTRASCVVSARMASGWCIFLLERFLLVVSGQFSDEHISWQTGFHNY